MDGGFQRVNLDAERESWMTYGEPPVETSVIGADTTRAWLAQDQAHADDQAAVPATTRAVLDAWLEKGWPTPDTPDWLTGGYVTKERAMGVLLLLADQIDALRARVDDLMNHDDIIWRNATPVETEALANEALMDAARADPEVQAAYARAKKSAKVA